MQTNNKFEEFLIENNFSHDNAENRHRVETVSKSKKN